MSIHINIVSRNQRAAQRKANAAAGHQLYDLRSEATRAKAIGGMSNVFTQTAGAITPMIFTGVYERFPELQVCWIECGVGWIPHLMEAIDDRYWRNRVWGDLPISAPPSTYWHRNNAATYIIDRSGVALRHDGFSAVLAVHVCLASLRVDDPHEAGSTTQPVGDLGQHLSRPVAGRQHLDRQVRSQVRIADGLRIGNSIPRKTTSSSVIRVVKGATGS